MSSKEFNERGRNKSRPTVKVFSSMAAIEGRNNSLVRNVIKEPSTLSETSKDVIRHLKKKEGQITIDTPTIVAVHGTSMEAVQYIIEHGALPGKTSVTRYGTFLNPGYISVYPTTHMPLTVVREFAPVAVTRSHTVISKATGYANAIAQEHALLTQLGLPLTLQAVDHDFIDALGEEVPDPAILAIHKITQEQLNQAKTVEQGRRGFLLGFTRSILDDPNIEITDGESTDELVLRTNLRGLNFQKVGAIQPLGPEEEAFFQSLYVH